MILTFKRKMKYLTSLISQHLCYQQANSLLLKMENPLVSYIKLLLSQVQDYRIKMAE